MTNRDLQRRFVYCAVVAGKNARFAANAVNRLFDPANADPFDLINVWHGCGALENQLRMARTGNYRKLTRCLPAATRLDLRTCTVEDLESIHGIGPKSARFFMLWTRPDSEVAALDVHVMRWLRRQGHDCPESTPSRASYPKWERAYLEEARSRSLTAAQLDAQIWERNSRFPEAQLRF